MRGNLDIQDLGEEVVVCAFNGEEFVSVQVTKTNWIKLIKHEVKRLEIKE